MNDQLNELARQWRGVPPLYKVTAPNIYFVMTKGECVLATSIFNVANNLFESYVQARSKDSAVLADRRIGDIANYYPATGISLDARNTDYYQAQKYCLSEEVVRQHREAIARANEEAEVHATKLSKQGQWLTLQGSGAGSVYFFVSVVRSDELIGCQITMDRNAKFLSAVPSAIARNMLQLWEPTYIETVRDLKLKSYL